uniref:Uncharacterized protein n=1 Tax=Physcomitrium patens TaxID=3218 RepID=A0A2K1IIN3_PHYPA|nr:hypothetical protein PHYPA_027833 [Physcomitrium patens]
MAPETRGYTTRLGWCSRRRAFCFLKQYNAAPSGHSTTAVTRNATTPSVGPTILHRHGFCLVPHCTHNGIAICRCLSSSLPDSKTLNIFYFTVNPPQSQRRVLPLGVVRFFSTWLGRPSSSLVDVADSRRTRRRTHAFEDVQFVLHLEYWCNFIHVIYD